MELEAYDQAVDYYISSSQVLNDYRHIQSFNTIQESSDAIMSKLKTHMLLAIQEPGIRMTLLEDYVRLLMKLGHPVADLFTIYLNYHRDRLGGDIIKNAVVPDFTGIIDHRSVRLLCFELSRDLALNYVRLSAIT